jgi:hypothetical protein
VIAGINPKEHHVPDFMDVHTGMVGLTDLAAAHPADRVYAVSVQA